MFLTAIQECRTKAWRDARLSKQLSYEEEFRLQQSNEIKLLARDVYPGGVAVWRHDQSLERTRELLLQEDVHTIYGGSLSDGHFTAWPDILVRRDKGWDIVEAVAKTERSHDSNEVIESLAYKTMVCQAARLAVNSVKLLVLSDTYRYGETSDKLFARYDKTEEVANTVRAFTSEELYVSKSLRGSKPEPELCRACRDCEYFETDCIGKGVEHSVFELPRLHISKIRKFREAGVIELKDIPEDMQLTPTQERVRKSALSGQRFIGAGLAAALSAVEWPCSYLDFESVQLAAPAYPGMGCYETVLSQFSLHRRVKWDGELEHYDYLSSAHEEQTRELAEALIEAAGAAGSIVVYSGYEKRCIGDLCYKYPALKPELEALNGRLFDLEKVLKEHFYDPGFRGSFSLKSVVAALLESKCSYEGLAVKDGGEANTVFAKLIRRSITDVEGARQDLLAYCKQDTIVMVELHNMLCEIANGHATTEAVA